MQQYMNRSGNSGIVGYDIAPDSITVTFRDGACKNYLYTYGSAGMSHVENMKRLAASGQGLNTYIKQNVNRAYARKF